MLLSPRIGGAESAASSLESAWARQGHISETVYLDARGSDPFRRLRHLTREVRAFGPDVVVSHSALPNVFTRIAVRRSLVPVVCVLHSATRDFDDLKLRFAEKILGMRTAATIAVSPAQVVEYQSHFPNRRVDLVPNGVGEGFAPTSVPAGDVRVVSIGRVARQKDPTTWAQIASLASSRDPKLRFEWFGPTGIDSAYAALEQELRSDSGAVTFAGPTDDVSGALGTARIMLHTAEREAHSVALLEAAASGLPIICTTRVGRDLPDWIVRKEFVAGDPESGLAALEQVLAELPSLEARARTTAKRVTEVFGVEACAARYVEIFRRVL